jgi:hypothetical protein
MAMIGLAFLIGWGLQIVGLYCLALLGIKLTGATVLLVDLVIISGGLALLAWRRPALKLTKPDLPTCCLTALLTVKFFFIFWQSLIKPVTDFDLLACYTMAARMIFLSGTVPAGWPLGTEPVFPSLSQAWLGIISGSWNDTLITFYNPLLFLGLIIVFYTALRRTLPGWHAALFTGALATLPLAVFHAGTGYADLAQMVYYCAATIYLYLGLKEDNPRDLLVGFILLALTVWIKRSGLYYAAIDLGVLLLFTRQKLARPALLFALLTIPWLAGRSLGTLAGFAADTISAGNQPVTAVFPLVQRPLALLQALGRNFCYEDNWHLLAALLAGALCFWPRKIMERANFFLLLVLLANFGALLLIFTFSGMAPAVMNDTLLGRLLLHLAPLLLFLAAQLTAPNKRPRFAPGPF